jgi:hypothetical protein
MCHACHAAIARVHMLQCTYMEDVDGVLLQFTHDVCIVYCVTVTVAVAVNVAVAVTVWFYDCVTVYSMHGLTQCA